MEQHIYKFKKVSLSIDKLRVDLPFLAQAVERYKAELKLAEIRSYEAEMTGENPYVSGGEVNDPTGDIATSTLKVRHRKQIARAKNLATVAANSIIEASDGIDAAIRSLHIAVSKLIDDHGPSGEFDHDDE